MEYIVKAEVNLSDQEMTTYCTKLKRDQNRKKKIIDKINFQIITTIILIILYLLIMFNAILLIIKNGFDLFRVLLVVCWNVYLFFAIVLPIIKKRSKNKENNRKGKNKDNSRKQFQLATGFTICFYDNNFIISNDSPEKFTNRDYPYDQYVNAAEWKDAFFLHAGKKKELIIPKLCITVGTVEALSQLFREKLNERFQIES